MDASVVHRVLHLEQCHLLVTTWSEYCEFTLICCLKIRISASSATCDRSRSITIPKISLHKSNIEQQPCPILDQPPAGWHSRQGQPIGLPRMAGWDKDLLAERQRIKRATIANRRLQHRLQAA
ncbi:hypothetical protein [Nitrobacter sp. JJSN]|uniref:hypothetical protein n=1 Tax=Nitrobacter sp. JJSN TaxID=3453033 RepID=UPI003F76811E